MDFQVSALDVAQFSGLFGQDAAVLKKKGIQRMTVDCNPGYPCRVSLQEAEIGDTVLLLNFEHLTLRSPYRSRHAIFVSESAEQATPELNEVPESLRLRLLSVRAFDDAGMMIDADVVQGKSIESLIHRMLEKKSVEYLHVHNAKPGCYAALVERG